MYLYIYIYIMSLLIYNWCGLHTKFLRRKEPHQPKRLKKVLDRHPDHIRPSPCPRIGFILARWSTVILAHPESTYCGNPE